MVYLYGILPQGVELPDVVPCGVTGEVGIERLPNASVIFGDGKGERVLAKRKHLLAHAKVLEVFSENSTVLPMRFGTYAPIDEIAELISAREQDLSREFSRLAGKIEMGIRITFPMVAALQHQMDVNPYFRKERERLASTQCGQFERAEFGRSIQNSVVEMRTLVEGKFVQQIASHVCDLIVKPTTSDAQVLNADVLLNHTDRYKLEGVLVDLVEKNDFAPGSDASIELVGPIPLYNFTRFSLRN